MVKSMHKERKGNDNTEGTNQKETRSSRCGCCPCP
jgi:hypothetical protein